ncbi:complex I 51 kDa subunit family protein [Propionibacterium australiense]|uniref:NADH-quinone oxidoreductase subunit F n=1 Tax=Propionibacterium australiense TaxID=119981 RepID=A0A383S9R5_9ACTN|nr:NADH-ubiquinone oxidoreductase-F iron-sulfur binding region domain-containing protein [Propionibacterium australiense]RLP11070.1 NADH-quinone oxidoreductase subunit F [Propionibacterium australiense]RLP12394.1 NADH-quinone oxidoreductase subunit F [Propionibacterium australiense]SYZ33996.1 NADH:ubiquinone oxidoreductase, 51kDa subunit, conserved site [Propionibacterium australiense]VEH91320.1 NADH-quinone oxidoreductase subunit 1 [Propionibacterium australiense]
MYDRLLAHVGDDEDQKQLSVYLSQGGYEGLRKAVAAGPERVIEEISTGLVRGRGGAAYPTGRKWGQLARIEGEPKYIVCNADEGEPGTFKDQILLEKNPYAVIEGMTIAGHVFGSPRGIIYVRGEYPEEFGILRSCLQQAREAGLLGHGILGIEGFDYDIDTVSGGGAYVCGENSAMLNSIEGKPGRPRIKPPHLAEVGLYGKPTLVNNVESYAAVTLVMANGGQHYRDQGSVNGGGTKLVSICGHVARPGVFEVPFGRHTLRELIWSPEFGGGVIGGGFGFVHCGGHSGPIGFESCLDAPYDYDDAWSGGKAIGSGAIVVMNDTVSIVDYLRQVMVFFRKESCGKCTPCRLGTTRVCEVLERLASGRGEPDDIERLRTTTEQVHKLSACGLGQCIDVPIFSALDGALPAFEAALTKEPSNV